MLLFCPSCSNILSVSKTSDPVTSEEVNRLECQTCPYQYLLTKQYYERKEFKRKEKDDQFGGPGEWDNAQKVEVQCTSSQCEGNEAAFYEVQIRSADEPATIFYKCMTCGIRWRV